MFAFQTAAAGSLLALLQMTNAIQPGSPVTIPHGTKINVTTADAINTADLQPNFPLVFLVVAPYPNGDAAFKGAQIVAFVNRVEHGSPKSRAGVGFIFEKIIFAGGATRHIYAFVDAPNVKRQTQAAVRPPSAVNPIPGPQNLAYMNPGSQPVLWQANISANPFAGSGGDTGNTQKHESTGGFARARQNATDVTVPAGLPVTLVLAHDLVAPH